MFATMVRQLRYGARMIRGSTLHSPDMRALVADLRATIEEFEDPRDEASALQPGSAEPDKDIQRDMARRRLRPTVAYVAEHLPCYRDWFPENDVDPRAITLESFASIPLTSMSLLMVTGRRSRHTVLSTISSRATLAKLNVQTALSMIGTGFLATGTIHPSIVVDRLATPMHLLIKDPHISHLITTRHISAA